MIYNKYFGLFALYSFFNLFLSGQILASQEFLTAHLINEKIAEILSAGESSERENNTFQFKKYLSKAIDSPDRTEQENSIKSLRRTFVNTDLKRIITSDLGESADFIYKRLMHAELVYQMHEDKTLYESSQFGQFSGAIHINGYSLTGTLIPLPIGDKIVWHVLTCSHFLNGVGLLDNGRIEPTFVPSGKYPILIKNIKIFVTPQAPLEN